MVIYPCGYGYTCSHLDLKFDCRWVKLSWAQLGYVVPRSVSCVFIPRPKLKKQQLYEAYFSCYRGQTVNSVWWKFANFINPQLRTGTLSLITCIPIIKANCMVKFKDG